MAITILCPNLKCRMVLSVPEGTRGQKVRCKYCGMTFVVPSKPAFTKKTDGKAPTK